MSRQYAIACRFDISVRAALNYRCGREEGVNVLNGDLPSHAKKENRKTRIFGDHKKVFFQGFEGELP